MLFDFRARRRARPDAAPLRQWVPDFLAGFSAETLPQVAAKTPSYAELFPAGTDIYIAFVPKADWRDVVALARRLRREGMNPVPHVPARTLPGRDELERYLGRLAEDAGVTQVLALGGDLPVPVGGLSSTMEMLETGLFDRFGISRIGVAGHPEGHAAVADDAVLAALRDKAAFAARTDADLYVVSQFCFDPDAVIAWDRRLRHAGIRLPLHVGIAGPAKLKSLIQYAALCGVGASARLVTRQAGNLARLASVSTPDALVAALARYKASDPDCGIAGAHFFTFGGLKRAADWASAAAAGDFTPTADGFDVHRDLG